MVDAHTVDASQSNNVTSLPVRLERRREAVRPCTADGCLDYARHERNWGYRAAVSSQSARTRQKSAIRILGINTVFNGPTVDFNIILRHGQFFASSHADHLFDQIDAGDALGHWVFDLQPRIHFKEVETLASRIRARHDQLNRPGRIIAHCARQGDALLAHRLTHFGRDERRRCFLDDLLVPPLDRAFAFVQIENIAMLVAQYLDFDMARVQDEFLNKHAVIAETVQPLALGRLEPFAHVRFIIGKPHPLAAAAGAGLHHHRIADFRRNPNRMFGVVDLTDKAGDDIDASLHRQLLGLDLVAHGGNRVHRRADKSDALGGQRLGKAGAFGQEAIARMHRLRAGSLARGDDLFGQQIRLCSRRRPDMHRLVSHLHKGRARIGIRIDRNSLDPHPARGLDDAASNFATVGDQDFFEHYAFLDFQ